MNYFVTAIGTDSGKTIVSAILVEYLNADYWKPIQAGPPRDTDLVNQLVTNERSKFHPERYLLNTPASPHAAAKFDNVTIKLEDFDLPKTKNDLIIEGAGGLLVPLNDHDCIIDLIDKLEVETVLVCNLYLGSINHSLLSIAALKARNIKVKGIIFNGNANLESEEIILQKSGWPCLLRLEQEQLVDRNMIIKYADKLKNIWS
jgi:dethiobiotin synthetase